MHRISYYIFKTVVIATLVALLVLLVLYSLVSMMEKLRDVGQGGYTTATLFQYLLLTQPQHIAELFPAALLLGGLLGVGGLASSSELVVMRAAGCSVWRLVWAALQAGLLLGIVALIVGEFLAPPLDRMAQELRFAALYNNAAASTVDAFWARDGDYIIGVGAVLPGPRLVGITLYETGGHSDLKAMLQAQQASYSAADGQWVLEQVVGSSLQADRVITEHFDRLPMKLALNPDMLEVLASSSKDLAMRELLTFIDYLHNNHLDTRPYELTFWEKAVTPLTNLAALFIAMPFVFGSQRSASTGQKLMIGIILGSLFFVGNRMLGNMVLLYGYPPLLGAISPGALLLAVGAYSLHRVR
jgi:lipopolysaccharide export system permease protein